ncbi:MAG: NAD(P)H-dependent oxidoreductase [Planctomycetota bacterium]|jgi:FMN-dependent NADH-azoreductase
MQGVARWRRFSAFIFVQPGYTFAVTPEGSYEGLVCGKPIFIAYARGGEYAEGTQYAPFDLQKSYLEVILGFMGFTDMRSVVVEPTLVAGPDVAAERRAAAIELARRIAREF